MEKDEFPDDEVKDEDMEDDDAADKESDEDAKDTPEEAEIREIKHRLESFGYSFSLIIRFPSQPKPRRRLDPLCTIQAFFPS